MTSNVKMILDEVNARIKLAEAKTAEDPSNFDAFPGAENDQAVPEETKKPDPEVKDEGPASRTEVTGAEPGSDAPVQQDHLYEADEPVLTPDKKPADSADANAKEASAKKVNPDVQKVASDILSIIKGAMAKKAEEKKVEEAKPAETKPEEKQAEEDKKAGCCGASKPAAKPAAATSDKKEEKKPEKKAADTINLGSKILDKIASIRMAKQAGADDAINLIKAASEYNRGMNDAKALIQKLAQALEESANSADAAEEGCAPAEDAPEAAGAADAEAAIADAAAAGAGDDTAGAAEGEDPVTPEEITQAVNELVEEGQISSEDAASVISELGAEAPAGEGGEDVTEDQIAEGIAQAIESGEITEDEAQQLVQELVDAGADESVKDDVAAAPAAEAATDAAPAAEAAVEDAQAAQGDAAAAEEAAGAADAEAAIADAQKQAAAKSLNTKIAAALTKRAENNQIARYQKGFIQKCAEYGVDPRKVAQYIQARVEGKL